MPQKESKTLEFLYCTPVGRTLLIPLTSPALSRACGAFLDSPLSLPLVGNFAKSHNIRTEDFDLTNIRCFNDFFTRKIKPGRRPICTDPDALIAPCDGLLSAYRVRRGSVIPVKQSRYTLSRLLDGDPMAARYENGVCLVFRLCVDHYHRYVYADGGLKGENRFIPGRLHTVRPIALLDRPVFTENCREYTCIQSAAFGRIVQMEIGAMLVGKIANHHPSAGKVVRGQEKGMFLYGGSTVILLLEAGRVDLNPRLFEATQKGVETSVKLGQKIGRRAKSDQGRNLS